MPWTEITRPQYRREGLRYASDMGDAELPLIEPLMPKAKPIGRVRETDLRRVCAREWKTTVPTSIDANRYCIPNREKFA